MQVFIGHYKAAWKTQTRKYRKYAGIVNRGRNESIRLRVRAGICASISLRMRDGVATIPCMSNAKLSFKKGAELLKQIKTLLHGEAE